MVISISRQVRPTTIARVVRSDGMDPYELAKASFAGICPIAALTVVYYGSRGSICQICNFFQGRPPGAKIDAFVVQISAHPSVQALERLGWCI